MTTILSRWEDVAFVCPTCAGPLTASTDMVEGACGHRFPIVGGIPRFVDSQSYAHAFGFEWNRHRTTQLDSRSGTRRSREAFEAKTGLRSADLRGRTVLDVGVGSGRFAEIAAEDGATVFGMDLSEAVVAAQANLGDRARIVQADLFHAPFPAATFDIVYSIGVLHHTPDTRAAMLAIADLVKPGGTLAIWVYPPSPTNRTSNLYRRVTIHLPSGALYRLSGLVARLHHLRRIPWLRTLLAYGLPASEEADYEWRTLDTFDWYAPRFQWKHRADEVAGWFDEAGFVDVEVLDPPVAVRGRRIARPPESTTEREPGGPS